MKFALKIIFFILLEIVCFDSFALSNRLDVVGFGGYSEANQFSDTTFNTNFDKMTGYNAGGMILITLANRRVAPVLGVGGEYMVLTSKVSDSSNTWELNNKMTSQAGTGHLGIRAAGVRFRLFLLGNVGYGFSDKVESNLQPVGGGTVMSTSTFKMKNHVFYGGSAALLIGISRIIKIGVSGVYNLHSASLEEQTTLVATSLTYQEVSGNIVLNLSL